MEAAATRIKATIARPSSPLPSTSSGAGAYPHMTGISTLPFTVTPPAARAWFGVTNRTAPSRCRESAITHLITSARRDDWGSLFLT